MTMKDRLPLLMIAGGLGVLLVLGLSSAAKAQPPPPPKNPPQ